MGDKDYVDGIKKLLWSTWEKSTLSDDDYNWIEIELLKKYEDTKDVEYIFLLSELNVHKMNLCKNKVYNYSLQGIKDNYDHSSLHDNYVLSLDGVQIDFKKRNHYKIIKFYYDLIEEHPNVLILRRFLIENLIDNYRFKEAKIQISEALKLSDKRSYFFEFYKSEILYMNGYHDKAIELWHDICDRNKDDYICYFILGELYARFARYEDATVYYMKSFNMQKPPRMIDALQSVTQIHEINYNYINAIDCINTILEVYKEDYNIVDGEEIKPYIKDRERYQLLLQQK